MSATDLAGLEHLLRAQWIRLRDWVGLLDESATHEPSVLAGWTVADLVAHLGRGMDALAAAQPTDPGTVPLSLAAYVAGYAEGAEHIDRVTRELASQISDDPQAGVDRMAEAALAQLTVLHATAPDPVVQARRGPIHLSDLIVSRLIELVVHGDDLVRSTGRERPDPLEPEAVRLVSTALLTVLMDRHGWRLEVVDDLRWIRLACGRVPFSADVVLAALRPARGADSLPDLRTVVPLL